MVPRSLYHGSPYCCFDESTYSRKYIFLTPNIEVAKEYTEKLQASGLFDGERSPTLYQIDLLVDESKIFDTRREDHREIWDRVRQLSKADNPDDSDEWIPKSSLVYQRDEYFGDGVYPSFGYTSDAYKYLSRDFQAILVSEGGQGVSIAVFAPLRERIKIKRKQNLLRESNPSKPYKAPNLDTWLPLSLIEKLIPLMEKRKVSDVARSDAGFMGWYRRAKGDPSKMETFMHTKNQSWRDRRDGFVNRHMAQLENNNEPLWEEDGSPTRRHLALIAWAYSPDVAGLEAYLGGKRKNNGRILFHPAKYYEGLTEEEQIQRHREIEERKQLHWDDPRAYEPFETDEGIQTTPSEYTKAYQERFGNPAWVKALQKKSDATGVSFDILEQVYNRGRAAWRTGHRAGAGPDQWGMARVNSFLTQGKTYYTADSDLAAKAGKFKKDAGRQENPVAYIDRRVDEIMTGLGYSKSRAIRSSIKERLEYLWAQAKEVARKRGMEDDWAYITQIFKASQPKDWRNTEST